jgi:glycogen operon protein
MGDEVRRTQQGNNNAYCQDNEISWFDWKQVEKNAELLGFTGNMIDFIQSLEIFRQSHLLSTDPESANAHIIWHGVKLDQPDWSDDSRSLAFTLVEPPTGECLHVILNAFWQQLDYELPLLAKGSKWHRIVDTSDEQSSFIAPAKSKEHQPSSYTAAPRSSVVLMALPTVPNGVPLSPG